VRVFLQKINYTNGEKKERPIITIQYDQPRPLWLTILSNVIAAAPRTLVIIEHYIVPD
jgi:hypothetical protein